MDTCTRIGSGFFNWEKSPRGSLALNAKRGSKMISASKSGLRAEVMVVTPEMAKAWLEHNKGNRKPTGNNIEMLASEIRCNRWEVSNDCVAFYEDGDLANGQHRLMAIAKAGKPVECVVLFGMSRSANAIMDQGKSRSVVEAARFAGLGDVTSQDAAITRVVLQQYEMEKYSKASWTGLKRSNAVVIKWFQSLAEPIKFAKQLKWAKGSAGVRAALACAYMHYGEEKVARLARFCDVLSTGDADNAQSDSAAIKLREHILVTKGAGQQYSLSLFNRSCSAIRHFMNGKKVSVLRSSSDSVFKIVSHVEKLVPEDAREGL